VKRIRVLVVDDSATMRHLVSKVLSSDPEIEVVGTASNANEAREAIKRLIPDVLTLDVEMPGMNGIAFLEKVMALRPMPVVMVSTLTETGSNVAIEALEIGAVDCVVKPSAANEASFDELPQKVKVAAHANVGIRKRISNRDGITKRQTVVLTNSAANKIVAIGASTGGVEALITVLSSFPENCSPTVITQHMPPHFTASLAQRLNKHCAATVSEARHGTELKPGHVYLAPGGNYHLELAGHSQLRCSLKEGPPVNGHCPSVDILFESVARVAGSRAIGVILTGMGRDGALGLKSMRNRGARTIGQDSASSVVYGMPKAAFDIGAVEKQFQLSRIGDEVISLMQN
jgi:two-component system, chemotaxis family, protein-glutamate methylesterase/glutaminase